MTVNNTTYSINAAKKIEGMPEVIAWANIDGRLDGQSIEMALKSYNSREPLNREFGIGCCNILKYYYSIKTIPSWFRIVGVLKRLRGMEMESTSYDEAGTRGRVIEEIKRVSNSEEISILEKYNLWDLTLLKGYTEKGREALRRQKSDSKPIASETMGHYQITEEIVRLAARAVARELGKNKVTDEAICQWITQDAAEAGEPLAPDFRDQAKAILSKIAAGRG